MQITGSLVIQPVYLHKCLLGSLAPPYLSLWTPNLAALSLALPYIPLTLFEKGPFKLSLLDHFEAGSKTYQSRNYPDSIPTFLNEIIL